MNVTPGQHRTLIERILAFVRPPKLTREQQEVKIRSAREQERVENAYDDLRMKRKQEQRPFGPF